jgi:centrosomal protein CEP104
LDPNERSNWKARELKSVFVEARAQFIKFSIFKNHINAINLFNQVGVVAINVLGAAVPAQLPTPAQVPCHVHCMFCLYVVI